MRLLASSFAILLAVGAEIPAQSPQPGQLPPPSQPSATPQRMPARPLRPGETRPKGSAVIKGYVMAVGTGAPVRRAQVRAASMEGGGGVTTTDAEGRFEIRELPGGRYNVIVNKAGYAMAYFGRAAPKGLQIVVTLKATDLSGLVTDDRGTPVLDATVIVFPANREQWSYMTRYVRSARPDTNGRYNFKAMPPHDDYLIIAVQNLESGQASDPQFLARATEEARPVSLNEGEIKAVDIKLSRLVP